MEESVVVIDPTFMVVAVLYTLAGWAFAMLVAFRCFGLMDRVANLERQRTANYPTHVEEYVQLLVTADGEHHELFEALVARHNRLVDCHGELVAAHNRVAGRLAAVERAVMNDSQAGESWKNGGMTLDEEDD